MKFADEPPPMPMWWSAPTASTATCAPMFSALEAGVPRHDLVRGLVPRERLPDWPMDRWQMWAGPKKHFLVFPVRHGEMVNYVGFVPATRR